MSTHWGIFDKSKTPRMFHNFIMLKKVGKENSERQKENIYNIQKKERKRV
jgi:hypothetical protein